MARNPEIKVVITGDSKGLTATLDNVKKQLASFNFKSITDSINNNFKNIGSEIKESVKPLKDLEKSLNNTSDTAKKTANELEQAFKAIGIKSVKKLEQEILNVGKALDKIKDVAAPEEIARASEAAAKKVAKLRKEIGLTDEELIKAEKQAKELQNAFNTLNLKSAAQIKKEIKDIEDALQRVKATGNKIDIDRAAKRAEIQINKLNAELNGTTNKLTEVKNKAKELDNAFKKLNFTPSFKIEEQKKELINAYETIKNSGKLSAIEQKQAFDQLQKSLKELGTQSTQTAKTGMDLSTQFTRAFKTFTLFAGSAAVIQGAITAITSFFTTGFKAVNEFELSIISLAATMTTFNKDAVPGDIVSEYEHFKDVARSAVPIIEELAATTLLSGDNVNRMVLEFAKGGQIIDATNSKQIQSFKNISNALAIILGEQATMKQIGQEIGDLWQGQITMASSLGQVLKGVIGPNIKKVLLQWKEQGVLIEKVGETLSAFGVASKDLEKSWQAVASTLETTFKRVLREDFGKINNQIIEATLNLNDFLKNNKQVISDIVSFFSKLVFLTDKAIRFVLLLRTAFNKVKEASDFVNIPKRIYDWITKSDEATKNQVKSTKGVAVAWTDAQEKSNAYLQTLKQISVEQSKKTTNIGVSGGNVSEESQVVQIGGRVNAASKLLEKEKEIELSLTEQINNTIKLVSEQNNSLTVVTEKTKEEKKAEKELQSVVDKYVQMNESARQVTAGLNEHQIKVKEIQKDLEENLKIHGYQPKLIDEATDAILRELEASNKLNDSIKERNELSAQETIAELGTTAEERIAAIQKITDIRLKELDKEFEKQKQLAEDETSLRRALELEKRKIILEESDKISEINKEFVDKQKRNFDEELSNLENSNMKKGDSYKEYFRQVENDANSFKNSLIDNEKELTSQTKEQLDNRTNLLRKQLENERNLSNRLADVTPTTPTGTGTTPTTNNTNTTPNTTTTPKQAIVVEPGTIGGVNNLKTGSEKAAEAAQSLKDKLNEAGESLKNKTAANNEATAQTNSFAKALKSVQDPIASYANAITLGTGTGPSIGLANNVTSLLRFADTARMTALRENINLAQTGQLQAQGRTVTQEEVAKWIEEFNKLSEKLGTGERIGGRTKQEGLSINNVYNIQTPNVESFRLSKKQLNEEANRQAEQTARRMKRGVVSAGFR